MLNLRARKRKAKPVQLRQRYAGNGDHDGAEAEG